MNKYRKVIDEKLKEWEKSDQLTKSVEQEETKLGIGINAPITEENLKKLSADVAIISTTTSKTLNVPLSATSKTLSVSLYGQQNDYYCGPASTKMISAYYNKQYTQDYIYQKMGGAPPGGVGPNDLKNLFINYLGKTNSAYTSSCSFNNVRNEINNTRPYASFISSPHNHIRVCRGYSDTGYGVYYLAINDPLPVGSGTRTLETFGNECYQVFAR